MLIAKDVWNFIVDMRKKKFLRYDRNFYDIEYMGGRNFCHIAEISIFFHIQNKIPNMFYNHHFSISHLHHGDLLWGTGPSPADARKNCGNFPNLSWFSIFITARHMFHNHFGDSERVDNHSLQ